MNDTVTTAWRTPAARWRHVPRVLLSTGLAIPLLMTCIPVDAVGFGTSRPTPISAAAPASAANEQPVKVSPYVLAGRQRLQAASTPTAVPASMRRTRQAIGR